MHECLFLFFIKLYLLHQKYFIAIVPPEPILSQIQRIKKEISENYQTKGSLRSPGHITLHMPFSWDDTKEDKLVSVLEAFNYTDDIEIELKNFLCFEPRVVFIEVVKKELLDQLQKKLVQYCKQSLQLFNQSDDLRGFHPHVTVAFRDLKKSQFFKVWEEYKDKKYNTNFTCKSICLLKQVHDKWVVYKEFKFIEG